MGFCEEIRFCEETLWDISNPPSAAAPRPSLKKTGDENDEWKEVLLQNVTSLQNLQLNQFLNKALKYMFLHSTASVLNYLIKAKGA